ncbi:MAG TPA: hypothetical protein PLO13_03540 [Anaerolineaceae bacterium]|jgi:hypothetical protein|nr:hypothetical protein [Anaerolineaceae bacterium]
MEILLSEVFTGYVHQSKPRSLSARWHQSRRGSQQQHHSPRHCSPQDNIEIMAIDEILQGLNSPDAYFSGYVVIVGHGHPV